MSSNATKPFQGVFDGLDILPASADLGEARFKLRFDQVAIAAEVIGDFAAAAIGLVVSYLFYRFSELGKGVAYSMPALVIGALAFGLLFVIMLDREGAYRAGSGMLRISETERILRVSVQTFFVLFAVSIVTAQLMPRAVLAIALFLVPMTVVVEKQMFFSLVGFLHTRGRGVRKAIVYGAGFTGKHVYSALLRSRKLGINPVVFVDDDEELVGKSIFALGYHHEECAPIIHGPVTSQLIESYGADMVVVAIPSLGQEKMSELAVAAREASAELSFVPSEAIHEDAWVDYADVDGIMLATVGAPKSMYLYERVKRIVDILLSVTAVVLLSPVFAVLALAVRFDSEGPIIFKQLRVGRNGRLFEILKFRTMRVDAPRYHHSPTTVEDPRITRIGRILRKTSLDELPQILNVIRGDMSLVGPRPEMLFIVEMYGARELQRLSVMPGITGMWQLSGDRAYLIHENLHYDLYYIRNRGFFMDIAIMLHTALFAVRGV
jgi:exopolysaccharide biosynthesis polyprenyl glycosylphosphotransferase